MVIISLERFESGERAFSRLGKNTLNVGGFLLDLLLDIIGRLFSGRYLLFVTEFMNNRICVNAGLKLFARFSKCGSIKFNLVQLIKLCINEFFCFFELGASFGGQPFSFFRLLSCAVIFPQLVNPSLYIGNGAVLKGTDIRQNVLKGFQQVAYLDGISVACDVVSDSTFHRHEPALQLRCGNYVARL